MSPCARFSLSSVPHCHQSPGVRVIKGPLEADEDRVLEHPIDAADALQLFTRRVSAEPDPLVEGVRHVCLLAMTPAIPFRPFYAVPESLVQLGEDVAHGDARGVLNVDVPGVRREQTAGDAEEWYGGRGGMRPKDVAGQGGVRLLEDRVLGREAHVPEDLRLNRRRLQRCERRREGVVEFDSVGDVH